MRSLAIAMIVWLVLIAATSSYGGLMSLYTGSGPELPKWNGWFYLFFCAKEGAKFGALLTCPIPVVVFLLSWMVSRGKDAV